MRFESFCPLFFFLLFHATSILRVPFTSFTRSDSISHKLLESVIDGCLQTQGSINASIDRTNETVKQLNTKKNNLYDTNIELEKKLAALKLENDSLKEALQNTPVNLGFSDTLKTRDELLKHSLFKDNLNLNEAGGKADRKRQFNWDIFRDVMESVLNRL
jgi:hypothetical protein